jgi:next to BRCA1 gene 1 protein
MATPSNPAVVPDTLITIKVLFEDTTRKFKLPLTNLNATALPQKVSLTRLPPPRL